MTPRTWLVVLLALLPAAATVWALGVAAADRVVSAPEAAPRNIVEAAALHQPTEVLRRLRVGEDPLRLYPVRPDFISSSVPMATVAEAAVWTRQRSFIALLEREGIIADATTRHYVKCLASDLDAADIVEHFSATDPEPCDEGKTIERVLARRPAGE